MAINKKLIHFKKFSDFNSKKLSANEANTQYTVGISGDVQNGNPDILYESIVWIKDTKQQWTHGQLYNGSKSEETYLADFTMSSLRQGMNNGEQVRCDMNSLIEAMAANKTILVREDEESYGYKGAYVLNGYAEDLLYFSIVDSIGNVLYCNGTSYTDISSYINGSTLYVQRWDDKGTYSKPSGGIPKSDLASDVQGVISSAVTKKIFSDLEYIETQAIASEDFVYALPDTANGDEGDILLSKKTVKTINGESIYGSGDIAISGGSGTITEIKANGTSIATSGVANIPAATTSAYGVTKLTSSTSSTSTTLAATASAVKAAYDLANSYKGTVSSVKINGITKTPSNGVVDLGGVITAQTLKTINGQSIVGSGDITISGGSSGANVQAVETGDVLDDVTVDYATKTYVDGLVGDINSTLGDINSVLESIISGGGGNEITFYIDDGGYVTPMKALSGMTWEEFVNSEYANQNSMFTDFRLFSVGTYYGIDFYHEEAMDDMSLYRDRPFTQYEKSTDIIEDDKTYYAR